MQSACLGVLGIEKAPRLNATVLALLRLAGITCFIQFTEATEKTKKGEFLPFRLSFSIGSPSADSLFLKYDIEVSLKINQYVLIALSVSFLGLPRKEEIPFVYINTYKLRSPSQILQNL